MAIDFLTLEYLKNGNPRQRLAYEELLSHHVFSKLRKFHPILTGTIPIEIDLPQSDLDIICHCEDHGAFAESLESAFHNEEGFLLQTKCINDELTTIANFRLKHFEIEIFGQNIPTEEQNAYRHMRVEHYFLKKKGSDFREQIIKLKENGLKTEPAFAKLLGLQGNPYEEMLKLYKLV